MTIPSLRASLLALSVLSAGPVLAQATTDDDETTTIVEGEATTTVVEGEAQAVEAVAVEDEDDGFDLGWLGLLGLLGLAGLGGRRREVVVTHPATVTTHPTTSR